MLALLFRNGRFFRFWLSRLISTLGSTLTRVAIPLVIFESTRNATLTSFATFVSLLPIIIFGLPSGVFADKHHRLKIMIISEIISGVIIAFLIMVNCVLGFNSYCALICIFLINSLACYFDSANFGNVVEIVSQEKIGQANSLIYGINTMMALIGPPIGIFLLETLSLKFMLSIDFCSFIISSILLASTTSREILKTRNFISQSSTSLMHDLWFGLQYIKNDKTLREIISLGAASGIAGGALTAATLLLVNQRFHDIHQFLALAFFIGGTGAFLGSIMQGILISRISALKLAKIGYICCSIAFIAILISTNKLAYLISLFVWDLCYSCTIISSITARQIILPHELQSRINSTARTIAWGGEVIGSGIFTVLIPYVHLYQALLICCIPLIILNLKLCMKIPTWAKNQEINS